MTETTKNILDTYEIRKTGKQKTEFLQYVQNKAGEWGYDSHIEKGWFDARNLVVGDPVRAKVVYTAHYDTCAVLPFPNFITPKHMGIYLLYQIAVVLGCMLVPMTALMLLAGWICSEAGLDGETASAAAVLIGYIWMLTFLVLMMAGPANRHTANDNTSGVTTLLELMEKMPEGLRADAAFIFFDLEEMGLFGSGGYASKHKKEMRDKLLINFDCVSDGKNILLAVQKKAGKYIPALQAAFPENEIFHVEILQKGVFYPSDQVNFPCGVGVASLKRSKIGNILYMDRIHTKKDTVYQAENIACLTEASIRLTAEMAR